MPNHGKGVISIEPRPQSICDFLGLKLGFVSLFDYVYDLPLALHDVFSSPMAQYSLFVLKVPLNTSHLIN